MTSLTALALLVSLGCTKDDGEDTGEWLDADNDGYDTRSDCDDDDAGINPAEDELCDGIDNDCDGEIDLDAVDGTTFYVDADADTYGDPSTATDACQSERSDWVENGEDCDDTSAEIFPGNSEICDGLDNDCDDQIDNDASDAGTYYTDADGDSYGDPSSAVLSCDGAGFSENDLDCDDSESAVNPGETEVCNDGLDNDCDGSDNGCGSIGLVDLADADITWNGSNAGDKMGGPVRSVGDMDGDGNIELAFSARGFDSGAGAVYLVEGPFTAGDYDIESEASARISGENAGDEVFAVTGIGDFTGSGNDALAMSGRKNDSAGSNFGAVYLFFSAPTGNVSVTSADVILTGEGEGDQAGILSSADDMDDDGMSDFLVGVQRNDGGNGAVYLATGDSVAAGRLSESTAIFRGTADAQFGGGLSGVGDLNGDGIADAIIGAPYDDTTAEDAGAVFIFFGATGMNGNFTDADADAALYGASKNDQAGWGIGAAGDHDGDGSPDLLISATRSDLGASVSGAVYLVGGAFSGTDTVDDIAIAVISGEGTNDKLAPSFGGVDLNVDGQLDVLVASRSNSSNAGAAYLFLGPISGTFSASTADGIFTGTNAGDGVGAPVNVPGDMNEDGVLDILIGGRDADPNGDVDAGSAYVIFGGAL
ncbi:MAG: hypothetical protein ACI9VR_002670 [Cognaticolwellia sp.]|jgi:hypothetical protein